MAGPIDAIRAIHNAFRKDMEVIDSAALGAARGEPDLGAALERFRFFNEILAIHARGEEIAVFPALEEVAPLVAEAYIDDHRGLDQAFDALDAAVAAGDALATARAAAAFKFHLDIHLFKEDTHLYRIFGERVPMPDQGKVVGVMAAEIPRELQPEFIMWMYPLLGDDDRENMTRIQQMVLPPEAFAGVKQLIQRSIGEGWTELTRRMPELSA
jgi:hypothetical protein